MTADVRCPYCGRQYTAAEGRGTCASCGLHASCALLRCPNCGYEMPVESRLGRLLNRIRKGGRDGAGCRENAGTARRLVAPLADLKPGERGRIAYIQTEEARKLQKLMGMGVLPGKEITLLQRFPSYVFQIGHSQFAVDAEIAQTVYVRV